MDNLGEKEPFCIPIAIGTIDKLLDNYSGSQLKERLVVINDGAVRIHNLSKDFIPKAALEAGIK